MFIHHDQFQFRDIVLFGPNLFHQLPNKLAFLGVVPRGKYIFEQLKGGEEVLGFHGFDDSFHLLLL
jgi:hypothetical protein